MVAGATPHLASADASVYHAAEIPGVNTSALTYFAASVFWRAAIHSWSGRSTEPAISLGPYQEQLRNYLNGTSDSPTNCILAVVLPSRNNEFVKQMVHPYQTRRRPAHIYTLPFLGISFSSIVGGTIPHDWREVDFVRGTGNPIIVTSHFEDWFRRDLSVLFRGKNRALSMLDKIERH
ncbi:MAG TPA: hypothetical protein VKG65_11725 [Terriglobales bacterium]|nr:hypothetical protein [Terriglobales bacterium]